MPNGKIFYGSIAVGLFIVVFAFHTGASAAIIRVHPNGNDAQSGESWALAKRSVQGAINAAAAYDEIWVAAGTYQEHIHNKVVDIAAVDVALYGGFDGAETSRNQRDWNANFTILDGTNTGTVVTISDGAGPETRVDGFYITRGTGGIDISGSAPVIANNTVKSNQGSGIHVYKYKILQIEPPLVSHPTITGNKIVDNVAGDGAGIAVEGDLLTNLIPAPPSAPVITNNLIARNGAFQNGGGIGCWGHTAAVIANNHILANSASLYEPGWDGDDPVGPWLVGGGGIFASQRDQSGAPLEYAICTPTIINNVVAANGALLGGGICIVDYPLLSEPNNPPPIVTNNTVVANSGAGIYWGDTFPTVRNNLVAFNTWGIMQDQSSNPIVEYNNVYGNTVQGKKSDYFGMPNQTGINGNISSDPKLTNYKLGEFHIQPNSPCIDAGSQSVVEAGWKDIDG
jgi:parallel beta-helix repeat protein